MVNDNSDNVRGNPLPPLHGLLFPISRNICFYNYNPENRIVHTTGFVTPAVEHWLGRKIAQCVHREVSIRRVTEKTLYHWIMSPYNLNVCVCVCVVK